MTFTSIFLLWYEECLLNPTASKREKHGKVFNPIIASLITSASRLILAIVEDLVGEGGSYYAYCDTDSIFVGPEMVKKIQDFFQPLNPYDYETDMFKVEEAENGSPLNDVFFYGISAKRYCLYEFTADGIRILRHSSHGLGHVLGLSDEWAMGFWEHILNYHYGLLSTQDIEDKYGMQFVARELSVNSPRLLSRFREYNRGRKLSWLIKPFNFIAVGEGCRIDEDTG